MKRLKLFIPIFWGVLQLNWSSSYPPDRPGLALEEIFSACTSAFISSFPSSPAVIGSGWSQRKRLTFSLFFHPCSASLRHETLLASWLMNVLLFVTLINHYMCRCHFDTSSHLPSLLMMLFIPTLWSYASRGVQMQENGRERWNLKWSCMILGTHTRKLLDFTRECIEMFLAIHLCLKLLLFYVSTQS